MEFHSFSQTPVGICVGYGEWLLFALVGDYLDWLGRVDLASAVAVLAVPQAGVGSIAEIALLYRMRELLVLFGRVRHLTDGDHAALVNGDLELRRQPDDDTLFVALCDDGR